MGRKNLMDEEESVMQIEKHCFTMRETLFEVDTRFIPIKLIGKGSYGVVCSSVDTESGEKVAIKKIQNLFENDMEAVRTLRELTILRQIKHHNVIALKRVMLPKNPRSFSDLYLVYELMDTDLHHIIKSPQPLSSDHCKYFMLQILCGLKYLHSANVLHRDLKPANLLVNADCELKICDFGLSRTSNGNDDEFMTTYIVTRWYRAPELLLGCFNYGKSIDMWSVGCIFAEILGREPIFRGTDSLSQIKLIIDVLGSQNEADLTFIDNPNARKFVSSLPFSRGKKFDSMFQNNDPLAFELLERMLVFDPRKRIGVTEALNHPYFSSVYDSSCEPPAQYPLDLNIDQDIGEESIREMLLEEAFHYH